MMSTGRCAQGAVIIGAQTLVEMGYNAPVDNMFVKNEKLKKTIGRMRSPKPPMG